MKDLICLRKYDAKAILLEDCPFSSCESSPYKIQTCRSLSQNHSYGSWEPCTTQRKGIQDKTMHKTFLLSQRWLVLPRTDYMEQYLSTPDEFKANLKGKKKKSPNFHQQYAKQDQQRLQQYNFLCKSYRLRIKQFVMPK